MKNINIRKRPKAKSAKTATKKKQEFTSSVARTPAGSSGRHPGSFRNCTRDYFNSLEDPFGCHAVCVPATFSPPSQKVYFRGYSSMSTSSTTGVGFALFSPGQGVTEGTCFYTTVPTYTGTSASTPYTAATGVINSTTNSIYPSSDGDTSLSARVVSAGLRIRNVTPLMNRGAYVVGYEAPSHGDLLSNSSASDSAISPMSGWQDDEMCERVNSDSGDWISVVYHPISEVSNEYCSLTQLQAFSENSSTLGNFYLGFWAQTSSTNAQVFEVEYCVSAEIIGSSAIGTTPSESDPQGLAIVNNITSIADVRKPRLGDRIPVLKRILSAGRAFVGFAADFLPIARSMLSLL